LEALAEGYFWGQTTNGIRLPTPMLREYDRVPGPMTKELMLKEHRFTKVLVRCGETRKSRARNCFRRLLAR
jgi:hypothetical protein